MAELHRPSFDEQKLAFDAMKPLADPTGGMTVQQERFVFLLVQGMSPKQAARGAGYSEGTTPSSILSLKAVGDAVKWFQETGRDQVKVNRDKLTVMLFDAHSHAATATEEIAAVRELGKMHGLYESDQQKAKANQVNVEIKVSKYENMTDDELMRIAGIDSLEPEKPVLEHQIGNASEKENDTAL
jgi:hypothetical protein